MHRQKLKPIDAFEREWRAWHEKEVAEELPPSGAINGNDYAKLAGCSPSAAVSALRAKERAGKLKSGLFRVRCGSRRGQVRFWWRTK